MGRRKVEILILRKDGLADETEAVAHKDVEGVFVNKNDGWMQDNEAGTFFTSFDIPTVTCSACESGEEHEDDWHPFEEVYDTGYMGKAAWYKWGTATRGIAMHGRGNLLSSSTDWRDRDKEGDENLQAEILHDIGSRSETAAFVATDPAKKKRDGANTMRYAVFALVTAIAVAIIVLSAQGWPEVQKQVGAFISGTPTPVATPTPESILNVEPTQVPEATPAPTAVPPGAAQ